MYICLLGVITHLNPSVSVIRYSGGSVSSLTVTGAGEPKSSENSGIYGSFMLIPTYKIGHYYYRCPPQVDHRVSTDPKVDIYYLVGSLRQNHGHYMKKTSKCGVVTPFWYQFLHRNHV